jgi:hypothetical protein
MGYTPIKRNRRVEAVRLLARWGLCGFVVLGVWASFAPIWTGTGDVYFYDCFSGPCGPPPFETKWGPDGRPRIITKTNFWNSDVYRELTG